MSLSFLPLPPLFHVGVANPSYVSFLCLLPPSLHDGILNQHEGEEVEEGKKERDIGWIQYTNMKERRKKEGDKGFSQYTKTKRCVWSVVLSLRSQRRISDWAGVVLYGVQHRAFNSLQFSSTDKFIFIFIFILILMTSIS